MTDKTIKRNKLRFIIKKLKSVHGHSETELERCLELKFGTIKKVLAMKDPPAEMVTLFKIIYSFPWLIEVADNGYDAKYAKQKLLFVAAVSMMNKVAEIEED